MLHIVDFTWSAPARRSHPPSTELTKMAQWPRNHCPTPASTSEPILLMGKTMENWFKRT